MTNFFEYPDVSSRVAGKREEPTTDDGSTLKTASDDDAPATVTVTPEAGPEKESDAGSENTDERKLIQEENLSHEDDSKLHESPEAEQHETKENTEDRRTSDTDMHMHDHDDLDSEELVATDAVVAVSPAVNAAVLLSFEPPEITRVQNDSGRVSPAGCQSTGGDVEPLGSDVVGGSGAAAEAPDVETRSETETRDSETANVVVPPSPSTTAPDAVLGKIDGDLQMVSADGPDVAGDGPESAVNSVVADQPDEDKTSELPDAERCETKQDEEPTGESSEVRHHDDWYSRETPETAAPSTVTPTPRSDDDAPADELRALTEDWSEVADKAPCAVVSADDELHVVSASASEPSAPAVSEDWCARVDELESAVDTAAAADDDAGSDGDVGETTSREPTAQSVLSARDVFIEQQVTCVS